MLNKTQEEDFRVRVGRNSGETYFTFHSRFDARWSWNSANKFILFVASSYATH